MRSECVRPAVLNLPVLVLNLGWQAIQVVAAYRALSMLWQGEAEAVDHFNPDSFATYAWADWATLRAAAGDDVVHTASQGAVVVPRAIRVGYNKLPKRGVTCSRLNIMKRDRYLCQYVGCPDPQPGTEDLTLDHVVPRSQGGTFSWENIVTCCFRCNQKKAGRTPEQAGMRLRQKPARPSWKPLFQAAAARATSFQRLLDMAYWNVPLQEG